MMVLCPDQKDNQMLIHGSAEWYTVAGVRLVETMVSMGLWVHYEPSLSSLDCLVLRTPHHLQFHNLTVLVWLSEDQSFLSPVQCWQLLTQQLFFPVLTLGVLNVSTEKIKKTNKLQQTVLAFHSTKLIIFILYTIYSQLLWQENFTPSHLFKNIYFVNKRHLHILSLIQQCIN